MRFIVLLVILSRVCHVHAMVKAVFAHFMVSNTEFYTIADWENDMTLARDAKIDGFVMNMGRDEKTNGASLTNAFTAAANLDSTFKIVFSFDYAGNGLWKAADVIALTNKWSSHPAYFHRGSQPLVSTFEGPKAAADWPGIKAQTNAFFMPSYSSLGAKPAWERGVADGLFSWAAWPTGATNMNTFTDSSYLDVLNGKPYMMGVSPWFYTNMPGFRKNWLWKSDSLWFDRWMNVLFLRPEYVQIITWNDYGESHYIGPLRSTGYEAFASDRGNAPYNYAVGKNHNAWRTLLPYLIDLAKTNKTTITRENYVAWFRPHPKGACGTGGTTGNTASPLQPVFSPAELAEDAVFFAAVLGSAASIEVSIGGVATTAKWTHVPSNGVGLYRGSVPFGGRTGQVVVSLIRGGVNILSSSSDPITTTCTQNLQNWNPYVMSSPGSSIAAISPLRMDEVGCTAGFGDEKYGVLCSLACANDYCPRGACTCTNMGAKPTLPVSKDLFACPAVGKDRTYTGLCAFVCNYFTCPAECRMVAKDTDCMSPLPVAPPVPACVRGMANGDYASACSFTCSRGFCPPEICSCTLAGTQAQLPPSNPSFNAVGSPKGDEDHGLCSYTCPRGYCPADLCTCTGTDCPGGSGGGGGGSIPGGLFFEKKTFDKPTQALAMRSLKGLDISACKLSTTCHNDRTQSANCGNDRKVVGWQHHTDFAVLMVLEAILNSHRFAVLRTQR